MVQVELQQEPELVHSTTPNFTLPEFEALINEKGYDIIHEKALKCPCKGVRTNELSNCRNCGGTGYIFINPMKTRVLITNMNDNTKFKEWSQENLGRANMTVRDVDRLMYMDRITLIHADANFNEVRHIKRAADDTLFTYMSYSIKEVLYVAMFVDENTGLRRLTSAEYSFNGNKFFLNQSFVSNYSDENTYSITIIYKHLPQYHVDDLNREVMESRVTKGGSETIIKMPLRAVIRKAHYVLNTENINVNNLINNSYTDDTCKTQFKTVDSFSSFNC